MTTNFEQEIAMENLEIAGMQYEEQQEILRQLAIEDGILEEGETFEGLESEADWEDWAYADK